MDPALLLKKRAREEVIAPEEAFALLRKSELVQALISQNYRLNLFTGVRKLEFLLIELSEIPFALELPEAQAMLHELIAIVETEEGFSLTGKVEGILSCHQAMCTLIFIRAGKQPLAKKGIDWIMQYQPVAKNESCDWHGCDLYERFGCVGHSPCYDGLVKSLVALSEFQTRFGADDALQAKLDRGLDYLLAHRVFLHQDSDEVLYPDLTTLFYPYPYRTNIIEILTLLKAENRLTDPRAAAAINYLRSKQVHDTFTAEKIFMKSSWVPFDPLKKNGDWITDEINSIL